MVVSSLGSVSEQKLVGWECEKGWIGIETTSRKPLEYLFQAPQLSEE